MGNYKSDQGGQHGALLQQSTIVKKGPTLHPGVLPLHPSGDRRSSQGFIVMSLVPALQSTLMVDFCVGEHATQP